MVGQFPPAKVSFRLCLPDVAFSATISILTGGSFSLASGNSRLDHDFRSSESSKSKSILGGVGVVGGAAPLTATARKTRTGDSQKTQRMRCLLRVGFIGGSREGESNGSGRPRQRKCCRPSRARTACSAALRARLGPTILTGNHAQSDP